MFDSVEQFLRRMEQATGLKFPRTPRDPDDPNDCPICRALGMREGPENGVVDLGGMRVVTVRLDKDGFPEVDPATLAAAPRDRGPGLRRGRKPRER